MQNRRSKNKYFDNRLPAAFSSDEFIFDLLGLLSFESHTTQFALRKTLGGVNRSSNDIVTYADLHAVRPGDEHFTRAGYLLSEILSKYVDNSSTSAESRRSAAVDKWLQSESRNAQTNQRLLIEDSDIVWTDIGDFTSRVRRLIARILGPVRYPDILTNAAHTNGASTRVRRSPIASICKLSGIGHLSETAIKHWVQAAKNTRLSAQELGVQNESVLFTVPKSSTIDRVACKEPEINMVLQRSVGNTIRRRLKLTGIDLNDQTINQRLAAKGAAGHRSLATIDLSSASDSITRQLVISLLPFDWWSLLDDLRTKSCILPDGTSHEFEMFSTMGNGFTFELESLIFYAITRTVVDDFGGGIVSVYGDDIIAPCEAFQPLSEILAYFGFITNTKKTHYQGKFRESCGKHYHGTMDVTPFYIRRKISTVSDLILHLNHFLIWGSDNLGAFSEYQYSQFFLRWSHYVPKSLWGGIHPSDPSCLVTGDNPRKRMVPIRRPSRFPQDCGLTYWLWTKEYTEQAISIDAGIEIAYKIRRHPDIGERTRYSPHLYWGDYLYREEGDIVTQA